MAPRVDSLSQHTVEAGQLDKVFVNGSGFVDVQGVAVGDQWAPDFRVDGDSIITVTLPALAAGAHWVVVYLADGQQSDCDGPNQTLEIVAAAAEHAELRIDSITPEEITLPADGAAYWLQGAGLTRVTAAMTGHHAVTFEGYDDARLQIWLPQGLEAQAGQDVRLEVIAGTEFAHIDVPVRGRPDGDDVLFPSLFKVEPDSVPASGGSITVTGSHFGADTVIYVGDAACTDTDVVSDGIVRCTVPALDDRAGERLVVMAASNGFSSPTTDVLLLIAAT